MLLDLAAQHLRLPDQLAVLGGCSTFGEQVVEQHRLEHVVGARRARLDRGLDARVRGHHHDDGLGETAGAAQDGEPVGTGIRCRDHHGEILSPDGAQQGGRSVDAVSTRSRRHAAKTARALLDTRWFVVGDEGSRPNGEAVYRLSDDTTRKRRVLRGRWSASDRAGFLKTRIRPCPASQGRVPGRAQPRARDDCVGPRDCSFSRHGQALQRILVPQRPSEHPRGTRAEVACDLAADNGGEVSHSGARSVSASPASVRRRTDLHPPEDSWTPSASVPRRRSPRSAGGRRHDTRERRGRDAARGDPGAAERDVTDRHGDHRRGALSPAGRHLIREGRPARAGARKDDRIGRRGALRRRGAIGSRSKRE